MAIRRISELPLISTVTSGAYLPIVDPTEGSVEDQNKRIQISDLDTRISSLRYISTTYVGTTSSFPKITAGTGSPESVVTGAVGSVYLRTDGGSTTSVYFKESGTGNTGWISNTPVRSGAFYSPLTYVGANNDAPKILAGSGVPEGVISGAVGSVYLRTDGGATTSIYFKEAGSLSTGWVSNSAVSSGDLFTYTVISGDKTLSNRERTTVISSGLIVTLPSTPSAGFEVAISVNSGIRDTIVSGAGAPIMGYNQNLTLNLDNVSTTLAYVDATRGWRLF